MVPQALLLITLCVGLMHPRKVSMHHLSSHRHDALPLHLLPDLLFLSWLLCELRFPDRALLFWSLGYSSAIFLCYPVPVSLMRKTRIITFSFHHYLLVTDTQ